jgi:hypothetical protein
MQRGQRLPMMLRTVEYSMGVREYRTERPEKGRGMRRTDSPSEAVHPERPELLRGEDEETGGEAQASRYGDAGTDATTSLRAGGGIGEVPR